MRCKRDSKRRRISKTDEKRSDIALADSADFLDAFFETPAASSASKRRRGPRILLMIILLMIAASFWAGEESAPRIKESSFLSGDFFQSAVERVHRWFFDEETRNSGTIDAFFSAIDPGIWSGPMTQAEAATLRNALDGLRDSAPETDCNIGTLARIGWVVDLEGYFAGRSSERPVAIFQDEARIERLLAEWGDHKSEIRTLLNRMEEAAPEGFSQRRVYGRLSRLMELKLHYLDAIAELKSRLREGPDAAESAEKALAAFKRRYPGVAGVERIEADLKDYRRFFPQSDTASGPPCEGHIFRTPLFADMVGDRCGRHAAREVRGTEGAAPSAASTVSPPVRSTISLSGLKTAPIEEAP
jgi:hypothetical protein